MSKPLHAKTYTGSPIASPMPQSPIDTTPRPATPMPSYMPMNNALGVESVMKPHGFSKPQPSIIPLADYPNGRGGMRSVPMVDETQRSEPSVAASEMQIGPRPVAGPMPT